MKGVKRLNSVVFFHENKLYPLMENPVRYELSPKYKLKSNCDLQLSNHRLQENTSNLPELAYIHKSKLKLNKNPR
jgi:hypothetical protein